MNEKNLNTLLPCFWKMQNAYMNWNPMQAQRPAFG